MAADLTFDEISYRKYTNESLNSLGFYVLSKYGSEVVCRITKLEKDRDFAMLNKAEEAGRFAVENYNLNCDSPSKKLKFIEILNVNVEATAGKMFYITLAAKDDISDDLKHYQAKVWAKISNRFQVEIFRLAPFISIYIRKQGVLFGLIIWRIGWMKTISITPAFINQQLSQIKKVKVGGYGLVEFRCNDAAIRALNDDYDGLHMPQWRSRTTYNS